MITWNVYVENGSRQEIEVYNIFRHHGFLTDCKGHLIAYLQKQDPTDSDLRELERRIERTLQYYFWSKCEWEVILSGWPPSEKFREIKIDVYDQVMLNWDVFFRYLFSHAQELLSPDR